MTESLAAALADSERHRRDDRPADESAGSPRTEVGAAAIADFARLSPFGGSPLRNLPAAFPLGVVVSGRASH